MSNNQTSQGPSAGSIAAFVLGIFSLTTCLITGIPAWIVGKMELDKINSGQSPKSGETFAKVGMWLGIAATCISILAAIGILVYAIAIAVFISHSAH
ncbi:MAG: DUF4190 domain-containing protein [Ignavibacteria bacterium]|nr:DUF4190 domain-containing protein [Ignavibacteria bacterium]